MYNCIGLVAVFSSKQQCDFFARRLPSLSIYSRIFLRNRKNRVYLYLQKFEILTSYLLGGAVALESLLMSRTFHFTQSKRLYLSISMGKNSNTLLGISYNAWCAQGSPPLIFIHHSILDFCNATGITSCFFLITMHLFDICSLLSFLQEKITSKHHVHALNLLLDNHRDN